MTRSSAEALKQQQEDADATNQSDDNKFADYRERSKPLPATVRQPTDADPFQAFADATAPRNIIGKVLKFSKGDFLAGESGTLIKEYSKFVPVMDELSVGWVLWRDGKPAEHRVGRVIDRYVPPPRIELGHHDTGEWEADDLGVPRDPWQYQQYLPLKAADGEDWYTFITSTRGGIGAIANLCRAYARIAKRHPNEYPLIEVVTDSYEHPVKAYGRVKVPVFVVTGHVPKIDLDGAALPVTPHDPKVNSDGAAELALAAPMDPRLVGGGKKAAPKSAKAPDEPPPWDDEITI